MKVMQSGPSAAQSSHGFTLLTGKLLLHNGIQLLEEVAQLGQQCRALDDLGSSSSVLVDVVNRSLGLQFRLADGGTKVGCRRDGSCLCLHPSYTGHAYSCRHCMQSHLRHSLLLLSGITSQQLNGVGNLH